MLNFRLPLLIGLFRFAALEAVILNKAMSLVVVATALPFRARTVPFAEVAAYWPVILNLLAGSLIGAWFGAGWATRLKSETLYRVIAILLVVIAIVLMIGHDATTGGALVTGMAQLVAGVIAGFLIGVVASVLGVAGGEQERPVAADHGKALVAAVAREEWAQSGRSLIGRINLCGIFYRYRMA